MRLLKEAAQELLRTGGPLTVPAVAELAGVSLATAYRYLPNNDFVVLQRTAQLADDARNRLAKALIPLFGSDAIVWTTDMAELYRAAAI